MGLWQNQREERGGRAREGGRKKGGGVGSLHISPGGNEACHLLAFLRAPRAITPWPRDAPSLATPWPCLLPMDQQWTSSIHSLLAQKSEPAQPSSSESWELGNAHVVQGLALHWTVGPWLAAIPGPGVRWASRRGRREKHRWGNTRFLKSSLISQTPVPGSFQISCVSSLNLCDNPPVFLSSKSECVFDCFFLSLGAS